MMATDDLAEDVPLTPAEADAIRARLIGIGLTSCDFCGGGCCDPDCRQCYSLFSSEHLDRLVKNLVFAAALCMTWQARDTNPAWHPGCALEKP